MLKWYIVTPHQVITVSNDIFVHLSGNIRALAKKKAPWKEDLFFAVKLRGSCSPNIIMK